MHFISLAAVLAAFGVTFSMAHVIDTNLVERANNHFTCGAVEPPAENIKQAKIWASQKRPSPQAHAKVDVKTYVHVVESAATQNTVSQTQVVNQISALNDRYLPNNICFTLVNTSRTVNDNWAKIGGDYDTMRKTLHTGKYADLNLYIVTDYGSTSTNIGYTYFPSAGVTTGSNLFLLDGVAIRASTVPGGTLTGYTAGINAVHEVGHWFNLFHVFQGATCSSDGDSVSDTPYQSAQNFDCNESADSCPNSPGFDSVHNYMDYTKDACKTQFTAGQVQRMFDSWDAYRAGK